MPRVFKWLAGRSVTENKTDILGAGEMNSSVHFFKASNVLKAYLNNLKECKYSFLFVIV